MRPFHLAFPVHDLSVARDFYGRVLGCPEGRSSSHWIDFDLYGHQIVAHLSASSQPLVTNPVDGHDVPVPHFGVVLTMDQWQAGEQATMFFYDPSGNALEFKAFADDSQLFAT
jgi:uncharacterized protein